MTDRELLERYRLALELISETATSHSTNIFDMKRIATVALRDKPEREEKESTCVHHGDRCFGGS